VKPYPARVIWHDASGGKTGWLNEIEARTYSPYVVESYGWLLRNDKTVVTLAISRHVNRLGVISWADTLDVPRQMVRTIKRVKW
jgi:hypothetical protein